MPLIEPPDPIVYVYREPDEVTPELWRVSGRRANGDSISETHRAEHQARAALDRLTRDGASVEIRHEPGGPRPRKNPWVAALFFRGRMQPCGGAPTKEEAMDRGEKEWRAEIERYLSARERNADVEIYDDPPPRPVVIVLLRGRPGR